MRREYISLSQDRKLLIIYKGGCIGKQKTLPQATETLARAKVKIIQIHYSLSIINSQGENTKMGVVETLNLHECVQMFRTYGLKTSEMAIAAGIEQKVYPFGVCIQLSGRRFEIYKALVEKWLKERVSKA